MFNSFATAYKQTLETLITNPEYISFPRGQKIKEILNYNLSINNPYENAFQNIAKDTLTYLKKELALYFKGSNSLEEFSNASSFWKKLSTDNKTINSAYGYLLFVKKNAFYNSCTQWEWCLNSMAKDHNSRQAIMYLGGNEFQYVGVKDFVCTSTYHFFIRDNKIHLIVNRRSQDIIFGMTYDVPWELLLMQCFKEEFNKRFNNNYELGNYHLNCGSLHIYERHFELANEMLKNDFISISLPKIQSPTPILNQQMYDKWLIELEGTNK